MAKPNPRPAIMENNDRLCRFCAKEFTGRSCLDRHLRTVHFKILCYKCKECGKKFTEKFSAKKPVDISHLKLRFKCEVCNKTFKRKQSAKEHHIAVHLKETIKCKMCNKTFLYPCSLSIHRKKCLKLKTESNSSML